MQKQLLFNPRFTGQRFDDHTLPFAILEDLAHYEALLIQVAKDIYYEMNDAKRVPKGFGLGVYLKLEKVDEGSSLPAILLAAMTTFQTNKTDTLPYFTEAQARISKAIETAEIGGDATTIISQKAVKYFADFGKNLQEDEVIYFVPENINSQAKLTQVNRRRIVLASPDITSVESEIRLRGAISGLDKSPHQFTIQTKEKNKIAVPVDVEFFEIVHKAFEEFESNTRVMVTGTGIYNKENKLQEISNVKTVTILNRMDVPTQLEELSYLDNGWMNGDGLAFSKEDLVWLTNQFDNYIPQDFLLPYTFPLVDAGVQLEWINNEHDVTLDIDLKSKQAYYHYYNNQTEGESDEDFDLSAVEGWNKLVETLSQYFKVAP